MAAFKYFCILIRVYCIDFISGKGQWIYAACGRHRSGERKRNREVSNGKTEPIDYDDLFRNKYGLSAPRGWEWQCIERAKEFMESK